jgi:hypothetical protein
MIGIHCSLLHFNKNVVIFILCMNVKQYRVIFLGLLIFGCHSTDLQDHHSSEHTGASVAVTTAPSQHPTIRRFTTVTISGLIDSIIISDTLLYTARITVVTSDGQSEESPAMGQIIDLMPEFVLDEHAGIDPNSSRNRELRLLRTAHRGDTLHGTILRDTQSRWKLIGIGGH